MEEPAFKKPSAPPPKIRSTEGDRRSARAKQTSTGAADLYFSPSKVSTSDNTGGTQGTPEPEVKPEQDRDQNEHRSSTVTKNRTSSSFSKDPDLVLKRSQVVLKDLSKILQGSHEQLVLDSASEESDDNSESFLILQTHNKSPVTSKHLKVSLKSKTLHQQGSGRKQRAANKNTGLDHPQTANSGSAEKKRLRSPRRKPRTGQASPAKPALPMSPVVPNQSRSTLTSSEPSTPNPGSQGALTLSQSSTDSDVEQKDKDRQGSEVEGDEGPDEVEGGEGPDEMEGGEGPGEMEGGEGPDEMEGGEGPDEMEGGEGPDEMEGGEGPGEEENSERSDEIEGDEGPDEIEDNQGLDEVEGDEGLDEVEGGHRSDEVEDGQGEDEVENGAEIKDGEKQKHNMHNGRPENRVDTEQQSGEPSVQGADQNGDTENPEEDDRRNQKTTENTDRDCRDRDAEMEPSEEGRGKQEENNPVSY